LKKKKLERVIVVAKASKNRGVRGGAREKKEATAKRGQIPKEETHCEELAFCVRSGEQRVEASSFRGAVNPILGIRKKKKLGEKKKSGAEEPNRNRNSEGGTGGAAGGVGSSRDHWDPLPSTFKTL